VRLLVVDDHNLFRRGLVGLLSSDRRFSVVGEAADAGVAQRMAAELGPDLILLDNHLPGVRGIDAIAALREAAPAARIQILTVSEDEDDLAGALRAGADGYLLKTIEIDALSESILKVVEGDAVVSPEMLGKLVGMVRGGTAPAAGSGADPIAEAPAAAASQTPPARSSLAPSQPPSQSVPPGDPIHSLSPREREILSLIARGCSNKEIGRELDIAETTVKIHVQRILRKLDLGNRVHAAVYASERGMG
jgi:two-component system nitrate/nitrite response regulator NarL